MVNVILSSDEVTVLGGPTRLDVDLNIGGFWNTGKSYIQWIWKSKQLTAR